jgi:hypothetical protein
MPTAIQRTLPHAGRDVGSGEVPETFPSAL